MKTRTVSVSDGQFSYEEYAAELKSVLDRAPVEQARRAAILLFDAYEADRNVFLFGNGGSAALASHMAADLGKGTHQPGPGWMAEVKRLRVFSLTDNVPLLTAWSNDTAYENAFASQMANFLRAGDVAFAISGSGNSPSVLRALELARRKGAMTIGLGGFSGGKMRALLDCALIVPSDNMQRIEDAHLILSHMIFLDLKQRIEISAKNERVASFT
ncbi:MAG: D-sedoheptulose-7-phosphate isomerase [Terriglobia bacterium]